MIINARKTKVSPNMGLRPETYSMLVNHSIIQIILSRLGFKPGSFGAYYHLVDSLFSSTSYATAIANIGNISVQLI